jgi:hypothetical protein
MCGGPSSAVFLISILGRDSFLATLWCLGYVKGDGSLRKPAQKQLRCSRLGSSHPTAITSQLFSPPPEPMFIFQ